MSTSAQFLNPSEAARRLGVSAKALRLYEQYGLIKPIRSAAGWRTYFPYTPASTLLRGLRASIDLLEQEGLDNVFARHHRLAEGVRRAVQAWGLTLCAAHPMWYSDTVSAIVVPHGFNANEVIARAYNRYYLSLGAGLSQLAGKVFRIGHLGWLNEFNLIQAIAGAEMAMRDVGIPVEAGAGTAAAQEFYRQELPDVVQTVRSAA